MSVLLCIFLLTPLPSVYAESTPDSEEPAIVEMNRIIATVSGNIISGLTNLDEKNAISAEKIGKDGIDADNVTGYLNDKIRSTPSTISSLVIDPDGRVVAAAPRIFEDIVGDDISDQEIVRYANEVQHPVVSEVFLMKEGFYGISQSYPIFDENGDYLGYTDITYRPEVFLRQFIIPVVEENPYDIMIMQTDGLLVYESDEEEIGKNALTDPLYSDPQVHQAALDMTANRSGIVTYQFWNHKWDKTITRQAVWDTLTFDDQEWRIVVIRDLNDEEPETLLESVRKEETPEELNASITGITNFVREAADYARTEGRAEALSAFNNLSGPFVSEEEYIFAYDMNGTTLALPYQQGLIGKNRSNMTDVNGLEIMPGLQALASAGGGIMYYVYPNPAESYAPQVKLVYVTPIDTDWFIGSGIYLPTLPSTIEQAEITNLTARVQNAVIHAGEVGKEAAIADFNDPDGMYADGGDYIFAYEYDGTTLALPHQPELIGTKRLSYTDSYGSPAIMLEIEAARRGGGFVYLVYYNPDSGNDELKLCYISPGGEEWAVGSGIYFGSGLTG